MEDKAHDQAKPARTGPTVKIIGDPAALAKAFAGVGAKTRIPSSMAERIASHFKPAEGVERALENLRRASVEVPRSLTLGPPSSRLVDERMRTFRRQASSEDVSRVTAVLEAMRADQQVSNRRMFWMNVVLVLVGAATVVDVFLR